ncbi:hypothetical protein D0T49_11120 [Paludibacter sp. 221]|uniref:hypothetical protein n=1 Tax=Paludibacter sp. 221 TaxID=2302939 RepID=UPI0013D19D1C|nr:hypothetical protein [Paludibacter sp. 221]NDV47599.1 hypothetical protein [Paludibacter sp. 221]
MKKNSPYEKFVEIIKEKFPERGRLANVLMDMLLLEKEAIYRRLRGEVPFTFSEIVTIARNLDISLDNIVGAGSSKDRPFLMRLIDFENPSEIDYQLQEHYAGMLRVAKKEHDSEVCTATNNIPINLSMAYDYIYRFQRMKWHYQLGKNQKKFNEIIIPERVMKMNRQSLSDIREIAKTYYIWNDQTIRSLVKDIKYFQNIRFVTEEEVGLLKEDIFNFIDDFEKLALNGGYGNGKDVYIFISNLNFETSYTFIQTSEYYLSIIRSFTLNDTISLDKAVFDRIKKWMQSLIRTSTLISESNEVQRILFFDEQRKIADTL